MGRSTQEREKSIGAREEGKKEGKGRRGFPPPPYTCTRGEKRKKLSFMRVQRRGEARASPCDSPRDEIFFYRERERDKRRRNLSLLPPPYADVGETKKDARVGREREWRIWRRKIKKRRKEGRKERRENFFLSLPHENALMQKSMEEKGRNRR